MTGFDLHRLYTGARGTLGVLLEASLRLFPEPEREVALTSEHDERGGALESGTGVGVLTPFGENRVREPVDCVAGGRRVEVVKWLRLTSGCA